MDAQLKAKWVEALRSGDYSQSKGYLRRKDGFCCLGVLCDISGAGDWKPDMASVGYVVEGIASHQYFPPVLRSRYGLTDTICDPLMTMNDEGEPFEVIADYIEANL